MAMIGGSQLCSPTSVEVTAEMGSLVIEGWPQIKGDGALHIILNDRIVAAFAPGRWHHYVRS